MASNFTIRDVLEWARTKPADGVYDYGDSNKCAIAQFGHETGRLHLVGIGDAERIPLGLKEALNDGSWDGGGPALYTFGGLVKRLEALCPEVTPSEWTKLDAYLTDELVSS